MFGDLSRSQKKALREWADRCYERELEAALQALAADVRAWETKSINAFDLTERIHQFHDGTARELYKRYVLTDPALAVMYAFHHGIIVADELDDGLKARLGLGIAGEREV